jgi:formamidopyrimidine-DNA glycosylase
MPELPEVAALAAFLSERTAGRVLERAEVFSYRALKTADPAPASLAGRRPSGATRRGKFVVFGLEDLHVVFHLAKNGWLTWHETLPEDPARGRRGPLAARVRLDDGSGFDLTEDGDFKRLAVYVVSDPAQVPSIARLGPDALDPALDAAALARLLRGRRARLRNLLTDQQLIAGIGGAYSDEILHTARLSPFQSPAAMTPDEFERLHRAMRDVLGEAVRQLTGRGPETLKEAKREGLRVHRRTGERCPVCGDVIREVTHAGSAFQYCPTCQTGGELLPGSRTSSAGT